VDIANRKFGTQIQTSWLSQKDSPPEKLSHDMDSTSGLIKWLNISASQNWMMDEVMPTTTEIL
jgi:hypothetical protein